MSNSLQSTPAVSTGFPTALASAVPCEEIASTRPIVQSAPSPAPSPAM